MVYRISKFYLENQSGIRYSLNNIDTGVLTEPKGFGVDYDGKYIKVGDTWAVNSRELKQPSPSGTMVFFRNNYAAYQNFLNFIETATRLYLIFQPRGLETEYLAEIELVKTEKGGYTDTRYLEVPVSFVCKTMFHTGEILEYEIERANQEIRFDFPWATRFNDGDMVYFTFDNDSHAGAPFVLSFSGYAVDPVMRVYQNDAMIHEVLFDTSVAADDVLTFSTYDDDPYVKINGALSMGVLDFTKDNFFKLPKGTSVVQFEASAGRLSTVRMMIEKYYAGV